MNRTRHPRRAFAAVTLIAALAVAAGLTLVLTRLAAAELRRERRAGLESLAQQALASARAWTRLHAAELDAQPRELPLAALLPSGVSARLDLRRCGPGRDLIECRLTVERAGQRLRRAAQWPAAPPAGSPAARD